MSRLPGLVCGPLTALFLCASLAAAGDDDSAPAVPAAPPPTTTEWSEQSGGLRLRVTVQTEIEQGLPLTAQIEFGCEQDDVPPGIAFLNTQLLDAFLTLELRPASAPATTTPIVVVPYDPTLGMPFIFDPAEAAPTRLDGAAIPPLATSFPLATAFVSLRPGAYVGAVVFDHPRPGGRWPTPVDEHQAASMWRGTLRSGSFRLHVAKQPERTETFRLPTRLRLLPGLRIGYGADAAEEVALTSRNGHFLTTEYSRNGESFSLVSGAPEPDGPNAIDAWPSHSGPLDVTYGIRILATASRPEHLWSPGRGGDTFVLWTRELVVRATADEVAALGGARDVDTGAADPALPESAVLRLGTTFLRHPDHVSSVACSPDGRLVASCSGRHSPVRVWEAATGRMLHHLGERETQFTDVVFSPDGALVAAGGFDGRARVWNVETGSLVHTIRLLPQWPEGVVMAASSGSQGVRAVAFSPDCKLLAIGGRCHKSHFDAEGERESNVEARFAIVDLATGDVIRRIDDVAWEGVDDISFSPDGTLVATADGEAAKVWDVKTGDLRLTLGIADDDPGRVLFGRDGKWLLVGSKRGVVVHDGATGAEIVDLGSQGGQLPGIALVGDRVAASGWRTIRLWEADGWKKVREIQASWHQMRAVAASRDGSMLASGCGNSVRLWDTEWFNETVSFDGHRGPVGHVAFSPDGALVATGGEDGDLRLWDAVTGVAHETLGHHERGVTSLAFRPDGGLLASTGNDQSVRLWPRDGAKPPAEVRARISGTEESVFSPDGKTLAIGARDGSVFLWDVAAGSVLHERKRIAGNGGMVTSLAFTPEGGRLMVAHSNGVVQILDGTTGAVSVRVEVDWHWATDLACSPDGDRFAGAFHDGSVRIFDARDGSEIAVLSGHDGQPATGVAWSSVEPSLIASTGEDGAVRIWDPETLREIARFDGHDGPVLSVAFSPDGTRAATGGADTTVLVWRLPGR